MKYSKFKDGEGKSVVIDLNVYPFPLCNEHNIVDGGIVRWPSGERPSRSIARQRNQLGTSPRADYEETAFYHCLSCKTQFVDQVASGNRLGVLQ